MTYYCVQETSGRVDFINTRAARTLVLGDVRYWRTKRLRSTIRIQDEAQFRHPSKIKDAFSA